MHTDVVVLGGARTPFAKADGLLAEHDAFDLSLIPSRELVDQFDLGSVDPSRMNIIWGTSLPYPRFLYGGREVSLGLGLERVDGHATEYACATSLKSAAEGALRIRHDDLDVVIAGGSESLSHHPHRQPTEATAVARARLRRSREEVAAELSPEELIELLPARTPLTEPYSDLDMAYYAQQLMHTWGVSRQDADSYTAQTHHRAAAAREQLGRRILPLNGLDHDEMVRPDTSVESLATLRAVHPDLGDGVSVGNASRLTDGAAAVVLARGEWAQAQGHTPLGRIVASAFTAHAPSDGVLLGPAFTMPRVLEQAGLTFADVQVVEMHEAFAGQVLSNLAALQSDDFARQHLGRASAVGGPTPQEINAWGGSVSLGHPFGATGARLIAQTLDRLHSEGGQFGLIGLCVGGTRGAAMLVEAL